MIKVSDLISKAVKEGVDFGKGQIETRVHYLTRMGILPGAVRKQEKNGSLESYYPDESVDILRRVAQYQKQGYNLTQIKLLLGSRLAFSSLPSFPSSSPRLSLVLAFFSGILLTLNLLQIPFTYHALFRNNNANNYKVYNPYQPSVYAASEKPNPEDIIYLPVAYKNLQKIKDVNFEIK